MISLIVCLFVVLTNRWNKRYVHLCWTTTIMLKMDTKHMVHGSPSIKPNWTHNVSPLCDLCARITSQTCNMPWWRQWLKAPTLVGPWNCLFFFYCHKSNVKHYKQLRHVTCGLTFSRLWGFRKGCSFREETQCQPYSTTWVNKRIFNVNLAYNVCIWDEYGSIQFHVNKQGSMNYGGKVNVP